MKNNININTNTNLSILTNFGCIYNCNFCISQSQLSKNEYKFTLQTARDIRKLLKSQTYTRLSISGGGDPLYMHRESYNNIRLFYNYIIKLTNKLDIHLSIHTNFLKPTIKLRGLVKNFVVSVHKEDYSKKFHYWTTQVDNMYNIRFTYVIGFNLNDLSIVEDMLFYLPDNARLTLKQLDSKSIEDIKNFDKIMDLIKDDKRVQFLPSGDYNTYYNLRDNTVYSRFKDIRWH